MRNGLVEVVKLAKCNRCGDEQVAWLKSERTGKWYLVQANVQRDGQHVSFVAQRFNFHKCSK